MVLRPETGSRSRGRGRGVSRVRRRDESDEKLTSEVLDEEAKQRSQFEAFVEGIKWGETHERKEQDRNDILDLRDESNGETSLVRDSKSSDEPSEDGVNSDDVGDEGGGEDEEESQGPKNEEGKERRSVRARRGSSQGESTRLTS